MGDLLTKVDFNQLLEFHINNNKLRNAMATMCVREYNMHIPCGVIKQEGNKLVRLDEKPVQSFFVNGGIYVFQPDMIDLIPNAPLQIQNKGHHNPDIYKSQS